MFTAVNPLKGRKKLFDRAQLNEKIAQAAADAKDDMERRAIWLGLYKEALKTGRDEVKNRFFKDNDGALAVQGNAFVVDQLLRVMYETSAQYVYPAANPTEAEQVCIVAVGGYGRGELAPESDIDLLFLTKYKRAARVEQIVEDMLYMLWDLGLKVGQSTRSVEESVRLAKKDWTIATAILESRFIAGERSAFTKLSKDFKKHVMASHSAEFLDAKLDERNDRHQRMGESRYVLEPNIKDGKGGLRDLHTLYWAAKFLYGVKTIEDLVDRAMLNRKEADLFAKAQQFLWTLRCHLHYLTKRPEERLTFDVQPELADRLGYTDHAGTRGVERLMKHYFLMARSVGELTRIFITGFEADQKRKKRLIKIPALFKKDIDGFPLDSQRLTTTHRTQFAEKPVDMLKIFKSALESDLDIHPDAFRRITRNLSKITRKFMENEEANRVFLDILCAKKDPELTLRHMNECGLFGKFIPDFGRVVAQMQYDMYHVYTTDEHTIRAIGILNRIENGLLQEDHPTSSDIIGHVIEREVLYIAVLLHDIAKGRGGDHSILGGEVARKLCPRLGFNTEQTETVAWLVEKHLLMSDTAFRRDLDDPKTIIDFVDKVKSPERLRLLLCLTVVDIRAVGPKVWNNWKARLLRNLYYRAEDVMSGGLATEGRQALIEHKISILRESLWDWPEDLLEKYLDTAPGSYFLSTEQEALTHHAHMARDADQQGEDIRIEFANDEANNVTRMRVYVYDHPGLFARLSGAIALAGASIVNAKISTWKNGRAMDVFWLQDSEGSAFDDPGRQNRLRDIVADVLAGNVIPNQEFEKRHKARLKSRTEIFSVSPRVLFDNKASNTHTVIEVNGLDRPAILFKLTAALNHLGLQIGKAKISTYGEQVVDVFYVKDVFGMKIDHKEKMRQIRNNLLTILDEAS